MSIGTYVPEHLCRVPPGCAVVEMKYCEMCGRSFPRQFAETLPAPWKSEDRVSGLRRDKGEKLCQRCRYTPFLELQVENLLKAQDNYREQLPNLDSIHASAHPIRYDKSVYGRQTSAHRVNFLPTRRNSRTAMLLEADKWKARVRVAFREKGRLTTADIQDLIPRCFTPIDAYRRCYHGGLKLRKVGYTEDTGAARRAFMFWTEFRRRPYNDGVRSHRRTKAAVVPPHGLPLSG